MSVSNNFWRTMSDIYAMTRDEREITAGEALGMIQDLRAEVLKTRKEVKDKCYRFAFGGFNVWGTLEAAQALSLLVHKPLVCYSSTKVEDDAKIAELNFKNHEQEKEITALKCQLQALKKDREKSYTFVDQTVVYGSQAAYNTLDSRIEELYRLRERVKELEKLKVPPKPVTPKTTAGREAQKAGNEIEVIDMLARRNGDQAEEIRVLRFKNTNLETVLQDARAALDQKRVEPNTIKFDVERFAIPPFMRSSLYPFPFGKDLF